MQFLLRAQGVQPAVPRILLAAATTTIRVPALTPFCLKTRTILSRAPIVVISGPRSEQEASDARFEASNARFLALK